MSASGLKIVASLILSTALTGCMVGPDYVKPAIATPAKFKELPTQPGWRNATPADDAPKGKWWLAFNDPDLNALEEQVNISNQTIKVSEANYRQAQALMDEARAAIWPSLSSSPSVERSKSTGGKIGNTATAEVSSSWTLDLWGKLRRGFEEEKASAQASAADLANAKLSEQSALATAWFNLRQTDALHDLWVHTLASYQKSLDIAENQYKAGTSSRSDVITARANMLSAKSSLINTGVARAQYEHSIAILIGKTPEEVSIKPHPLGRTLPKIPVSLPSTLLERRPDIAAAERNMQSANAAIGVAAAAYYPDISLSGSYGVSGNLITAGNPVWSIGSSLSQTIFDAGLNTAKVKAAKASYDASVATYRQTVLTAFQQVDDELSTLRVLGNQAAVQTQAVQAAEQALDIAINEYKAGTQNYTTVVTAQANALSAEQQALTTRANRFQASVSLIVALGGGWEPDNTAVKTDTKG